MVQTFFDVEQSASFYHRGFWLLGWCSSGETLDARAKIKQNYGFAKQNPSV